MTPHPIEDAFEDMEKELALKGLVPCYLGHVSIYYGYDDTYLTENVIVPTSYSYEEALGRIYTEVRESFPREDGYSQHTVELEELVVWVNKEEI